MNHHSHWHCRNRFSVQPSSDIYWFGPVLRLSKSCKSCCCDFLHHCFFPSLISLNLYFCRPAVRFDLLWPDYRKGLVTQYAQLAISFLMLYFLTASSFRLYAAPTTHAVNSTFVRPGTLTLPLTMLIACTTTCIASITPAAINTDFAFAGSLDARHARIPITTERIPIKTRNPLPPAIIGTVTGVPSNASGFSASNPDAASPMAPKMAARMPSIISKTAAIFP